MWRKKVLFFLIVLSFFSIAAVYGQDFNKEFDSELKGKSVVKIKKTSEIKVSVGFKDIFKKSFYSEKLILIVAIGVLLALLGVFIALKKEFFMTLTIAQSAASGISLGLLIGWQPEISAGVMIIICLAFISLWRQKGITDKNAILALLYVFFSALSILVLSKTAEGQSHITNLLFGDLITLTFSNSFILILVLIAIVTVHLVFQRLYVPVIFDRGFAEFEQIKVFPVELVFNIMQGMVLAMTLRLTGLFFALAFMALLPTAVLMFTRSMKSTFLLSAVFAAAIAMVFFIAAVLLDFPASATLCIGVVMFYGGVYLIRK